MLPSRLGAGAEIGYSLRFPGIGTEDPRESGTTEADRVRPFPFIGEAETAGGFIRRGRKGMSLGDRNFRERRALYPGLEKSAISGISRRPTAGVSILITTDRSPATPSPRCGGPTLPAWRRPCLCGPLQRCPAICMKLKASWRRAAIGVGGLSLEWKSRIEIFSERSGKRAGLLSYNGAGLSSCVNPRDGDRYTPRVFLRLTTYAEEYRIRT